MCASCMATRSSSTTSTSKSSAASVLACSAPMAPARPPTLRMLLGLAAPASGALMLCEEPIPQRAPQARMRVGVVPRFDNLDPDFHRDARTCASSGGISATVIGRDCAARADAAGVRAAGEPGRRAGCDLLRRHAPPPDHGAGADQRSRPAGHGRADHRPGPAGAPPDLGARTASPDRGAARPSC